MNVRGAPSKYHVPNLERALEIIELLAKNSKGMHCIAAPIFNRQGSPIAAIWITGPSIRIPESQFEKIGKQVKKHADSISKSLGYGLIKNN